MLRTYDEFVARVNELGFLPFHGRFLPGFPMLQAETLEEQWHTGDNETDPWRWKDRAAEEKQLAFGCILGGNKGFIAKRLYPLFYVACHPSISVEERWGRGELSQTSWQLHKLFTGGQDLSTAEIRQALGVTKKQGASQVDTAVKELQKEFVITVCGNRRKVSLDGREYGWPANTYSRVRDWAADGWLDGIEEMDRDEARD
ncbi:MAG: hypothetical protein ACM3ZQ_11155, partial [Bacillota bacterium]